MRTTSTRWRLAATIGAAALATSLAAPAAGFAAEGCSPMVTHTPTGSQGDTSAVAITSQALEAGSEGWARAGWQAADGVTITRVTVVREGGSEHRDDGDLQTGMAEDALELRFCGTAATPEQATDDEKAATPEPATTGPSSAEQGSAEREATETDPTAADETPGHQADDRGAAPDHAAAGGEPARERAGADDTGPADHGLDTAAAATPDAPPAAAEADDGTGEETSGDTDTPVMVTTGPPTSLPVAEDAHLVEPAALGTDAAPANRVEQAMSAARSHDPATLLGWALLGLLAGGVVTTGAHRLQREVQR